jgi:transcription initiation factor TFIIIB Brf1 subunit/transcription initiation factor TFIIB
MDKSTLTCVDCGEEIQKDIFLDDICIQTSQQDNSRCHIRKKDIKTIYKDVEQMGFGEKIVGIANEIYTNVTHGKIYRGNSRKAIVFACIFNAYKITGNPQCHEDLIKTFNLDKKYCLKGLKHVNSNVPNNSPIKKIHITSKTLIIDILKKFEANQTQIDEVLDLYSIVKEKSGLINRSRPQTISAGLVYYYILKTKRQISLKEFINITNLSELTIKKIVKEFDGLFETSCSIDEKI